MNIVKMKLSEIKPAEYNPRLDLQSGDPEYEKIRRSIEEFGLVEPIVVNKRNGNIVGGHQRFKVLQEMGYEETPVSLVDLDDEQEKVLNIALNKIEGDWDNAKLKDLLQDLDTGAIDMDLTGFDEYELENLMTQFHVDSEEISDGYDDMDYDVEDEEKADTTAAVGEYRISITREQYEEWKNEIRMEVGFDEHSVKAEILRRLKINAEI